MHTVLFITESKVIAQARVVVTGSDGKKGVLNESESVFSFSKK